MFDVYCENLKDINCDIWFAQHKMREKKSKVKFARNKMRSNENC